jgi:mersacidin/lichenicidin family type 2 lantibiotic
MLTIDVIRAWKDENYRHSLSAEQLALLPAHPSGGIEVQQSDCNDIETIGYSRGPRCTRHSHCV